MFSFIQFTFSMAAMEFRSKRSTDEEKRLLYDREVLVAPVHRRRQIFAAIAANLGGFALGTVLSWTSPALPSLRYDKDTFPFGVTLDDESWIGSAVPLGAALGGPIGGYLTDAIGRKTSMCALSLPFIMGWLAIYKAYTVPVIVCGRFVTGVCAGALSLVAPMFVGEISDPAVRGWLAAGFELMVCVGILFTNVLGAFVAWRIQALAGVLAPTSLFLLMLLIPESPRFLMCKGRAKEARRALSWFRDDCLDPDEVQQLEDELSRRDKAPEARADSSLGNLFRPSILRPFSIALALVVFNELSAIDVVTFYTVDLFESSGVTIGSYESTIAVAVVNIAGAATAAVLADKYGRRFLLLLSQAFVSLSLGCLTLFFVVQQFMEPVATTYLAWLPLLSLITYSFAYVIGLGTVIYLVMGEILPHSTKGLTSGCITVSKWILGFIITKSASGLRAEWGDSGTFALFTIGSILGILFTARFVPETSGKTLEEIQTLFGSDSSLNDEESGNCKKYGAIRV